MPPYDELIYIVQQDRARDARVQRFLDAVEMATLSILNDPDEAWSAFVRPTPSSTTS